MEICTSRGEESGSSVQPVSLREVAARMLRSLRLQVILMRCEDVLLDIGSPLALKICGDEQGGSNRYYRFSRSLTPRRLNLP